jgi:hypothetical protein
MKKTYQKPKVETLTRSDIIKIVGPATASTYGQEGGPDL